MSGTRHLIILAIAALVLPAQADVDVNSLRQGNTSALQLRGLDRALMVRDRELPTSREETTALLLFCRQKGVTALFVACYDLPPQAFFERERVYRWRSMIGEAHRQGLLVYASTGNVSWVNDRGQALSQLDAVAQLGAMGGPGQGFDGMLLEFPALSKLRTLLPTPSTNQPTTDSYYRSSATNRPPPRQAEEEDQVQGGERDTGRPSTGELYPAAPAFDPTQLAPTSLEDRELLRQHFEVLAHLNAYLDDYAFLIVALLYHDLYASLPPSLSPAQPVQPDGQGMVRIPVDAVKDGKLYRYVYVTSDGHRVRFFLINRYDVAHAKIGVVYDACMICGDDGYIQVGNEIICIACNVRIFVPSIGKPGGCNPIPLDHRVDGDTIAIAAADLDKGAKYFSEVVEIEVTDPVTGKRLINLKAPFQYEFKGRMFFFEGRDSYERFRKAPEDFVGNVEGRYFRVQGHRGS